MEIMCRLCLKRKVKFIEILFEDEEKFQKCTGIQEFSINDGLSIFCCSICYQKINEIYIFQNECKEAEIFLRKLLLKNETINGSHEFSKSADIEYEDNKEHNLIKQIENLDFEKNSQKLKIIQRTVSCKKCNKCFTCERNLKIHISIVHKDDTKNDFKLEAITQTITNNDNKSNCNNKILTKNTPNFEQHYLKQNSKYHCDICGVRFSQKQFLVTHFKIKHLKVMKYTCRLCWKGFSSVNDFYFHFINIHCSKKITPIVEEIDNYFIYHEDDDSNILWKAKKIPYTNNDKYRCKLCDATFSSKISLKLHFSSLHLKLTNINHKCNICHKIYRFKYSLVCHQKIHNLVVDYNCKVCGLGFNAKHLFHSHLSYTHFKNIEIDNIDDYLLIKEKKIKSLSATRNSSYLKIGNYPNHYNCDYCKNTFSTKHSLNNHMKQKHDEKNMIIRNLLECSICNEVFPNYSLHKNHVKDNHPEEYSLQIRVNCTICNKSLTKKTIKTHLKIHEKRAKDIQCAECGRTFFSQSTYKYHMITHTNQKPFKCTRCSRAFYTKYQLASHSYIHSDVERPKRVHCNYCGKGCSTATELKVHLRIHTKERPFKCILCNKAFLTKSHLRNHSFTHSGERNYKCKEIGCESAYTSSSSLRKHYYIVHYPEELKTFQCDLCLKKFGRRTYLNQHRKAHGKIAKLHKK